MHTVFFRRIPRDPQCTAGHARPLDRPNTRSLRAHAGGSFNGARRTPTSQKSMDGLQAQMFKPHLRFGLPMPFSNDEH